MIVNEPVFGESLEIVARNLQKDGLKLFCDEIIQSPENIPVALSDQGSSELMDIITKINYVMDRFENPQILCNGLVYVKPKTAKFTFVQMMDTERYPLKLMESSALREGILNHLTTSHKLMSNPACELFPQLTLDLDLIEVEEGKCFKISQRNFTDSPFTQKDSAKFHQECLFLMTQPVLLSRNILNMSSQILFLMMMMYVPISLTSFISA